MARPMAPTIMRMAPIATMSIPTTWKLTANESTAPRAMSIRLRLVVVVVTEFSPLSIVWN
jgi:hypothetical protein